MRTPVRTPTEAVAPTSLGVRVHWPEAAMEALGLRPAGCAKLLHRSPCLFCGGGPRRDGDP